MSDEKEIKKYINENRNPLEKEITDIQKKSKHIYFGSIGDNVIRNYYLKDNMCIICSENNDAVITIIKLEYGFGEEIDKNIIKGLLKELDENYVKEDEIKDEIALELPRKQQILDVANEEIRVLEEQLKIIRNKKQVIENDINGFSKDIEYNNLQKGKLAYKLIYCINYKFDCLNYKNSNGNGNGNNII
jgi:hypothetical protein